jgi:hypothetical protein
LPEENPLLSADLEDYIKTLTGSLVDETDNWSTPYENEARAEKKEMNKVKKSPKIQSDNSDSNSCNIVSDSDSNSGDKMPDNSDDDVYDGYYYHDGRHERKISLILSHW